MKFQLKGTLRRIVLAGGLLAVVSAILYGALSMDGEKSSPLVYLCLVIGILLDLGIIALPPRREMAVTLMGWATVLIETVALGLFITERVQWLYALLSKMEVAPLTMLFPATIVLFVAAIAVQSAALYFPDPKA